MGSDWFVVVSKQGKQRKALEQLEAEKFEAYLPRYRQPLPPRRKHTYLGRRRYEEAFLFGRYLLVRFNERWHEVLKIPEISSVVRFNKALPKLHWTGKKDLQPALPAIMQDDVVQGWKAREDSDGFVVDEIQKMRATLAEFFNTTASVEVHTTA